MPQDVDLTGLARYAPGDPEPEFVDINERNEAVVTLQENNHIVVVDLPTLTVKNHFRGRRGHAQWGRRRRGRGDLADRHAPERAPGAGRGRVDAGTPGHLSTSPRPTKATSSAAAAASRSSGRNGSVAFDSGNSLEELAVRHGHYPEGRSDAKGTEPEAIVYARFGDEDYLFVGSERGNFVAVYTLDLLGRPQFEQLLPGPLGPEGLLAIPSRNLLVVSGEADLEGVARAVDRDDLPAEARSAHLSADPVG